MLSQKWLLLNGLNDLNISDKAFAAAGEEVIFCPVITSSEGLSGAAAFKIFQRLPPESKLVAGINAAAFESKKDDETADLAESLVRLFFHISYLKNGTNPLLLITEPLNNNTVAALVSQIKKAAIGQGFEDVMVLVHPGTPSEPASLPRSSQWAYVIHLPADISFFSYENFLANWMDYVVAAGIAENPIILLPGNVPAEAIGLVHILSQQESTLSKTSRDFKLAVRISHLYKELQKEKRALTLARFDNTNKSNYVDSQRTELLKILQWYEDQYEVLPLWYKRFGHIIKVFMGKRSFRSLFK